MEYKDSIVCEAGTGAEYSASSASNTSRGDVERAPPRGGRGEGRSGHGGRGGVTKPTAPWSDHDVTELFRLRYLELAECFKSTKDTKRIKYAWAVLASTLSVIQSMVLTDKKCRRKKCNDDALAGLHRNPIFGWGGAIVSS
ncbi:unnamed protein product [Phytophthora fragariaefolia]|uniref:Unnamed protein product n=1 Tax=Phytophthora fragariaefolia TaxID=1490495 RepID=A0A9W6WWX5_9STRA|nr:unnamed protein product [Phytophthora fragariaefolia]